MDVRRFTSPDLGQDDFAPDAVPSLPMPVRRSAAAVAPGWLAGLVSAALPPCYRRAVRRGRTGQRRPSRGPLALAAAASFGVLGCGESEPANLVRKTIGPGGDIITSHDGVLTIVIQPGALERDTEIEIFPSDTPPRIYGPAYRVRPDIELQVPSDVTYRRVLPTDPQDARVAAIHLEDYGDGEGHWSPLTTLSLDVGDESVTAVDDELSLYYGLLELDGGGPAPGTGTGTGEGSSTSGDTLPVDGSGTGSSSGDPTDPSTTTDPTDPTTGSTTDPTDPTTSTSGSTTDPTDPTTGTTTDGGMMGVCSDGMPVPGEICYVAGGDFPVGDGPADLVLEDFDGDLVLDVVTVNRVGGDVTIALGMGDGTFVAPVAYAVGTSPGAIELGDFDDDGELDLAVVNTDDDTVGLLLGAGDGSFAPQVAIVVGDAPTDLSLASYGVGAADDLVVINSGDATMQVLTGDLGGTLLPSAPFAVLATAALSVVGGEFNSDLMDDAFSVGAGGGFHGRAGNGAGGLDAGEVNGNWGGNLVRAAAFDLDGNGTGDMLIADVSNDTVQVRSGTGGAQFNLIAQPAVGTNPSDVAAGDLAGTGLLAVVVTGRDSGDVTIIGQLPGEVYQVAATIPVGMAPSGVKIGEVTGDGVLDIVVCNEGADSITVIESDP